MSAVASNYLLNSLWQVPLLWVCGWLVACILRPLGALAEHRVWAVTLLLQSLLPACSVSPTSLRTLASLWPRAAGDSHGAIVSTVIGPGSTLTSLRLSAPLLAVLTAAYTVFLAWVLARFVWRALALSTLRRTAAALPLTPASAPFWSRCSTRFHVHTATLATSSRIGAPVTFGLHRPLILLPTTMLANLSPDDLYTVLAHEFAHLHRRDFLKNILYQLLSLPISYHPLLWLTRARLTDTREIVCDQLAASLTGRHEYARSLLHLASLLLVEPPLTAPHAIGILDAHTFERRLMHLTETHPELPRLRRVLTLSAAAVFTFTACTTALALRVNVNSASVNAETPATPTAHTVRVSAGVMAGNLLTHVNPTYPQAARDAKIQGSVVLHAVISKEGTVENLQVISGPADLRASALDAVHQWTYKPYILNGEPTAVETTITVNYSLAP